MTDDQTPRRRYRPMPALDARRPVDLAHARRLAELKRQVEDGTYVPDPERIAAAIVEQGLETDD